MNKPLTKLQLSTILAVVIGVAVYLLDPANVWSFDFDDDDMRAAVEGKWSLTLRDRKDDSTRTYELEIRQAGAATIGHRGWLRSADACRSRSFVRSASACATSSSMELAITVQGEPTLRGEGVFFVSGTSFDHGNLQLRIGRELRDLDAPVIAVDTALARDGSVTGGINGHGFVAQLSRTTSPQ